MATYPNNYWGTFDGWGEAAAWGGSRAAAERGRTAAGQKRYDFETE